MMTDNVSFETLLALNPAQAAERLSNSTIDLQWILKDYAFFLGDMLTLLEQMPSTVDDGCFALLAEKNFNLYRAKEIWPAFLLHIYMGKPIDNTMLFSIMQNRRMCQFVFDSYIILLRHIARKRNRDNPDFITRLIKKRNLKRDARAVAASCWFDAKWYSRQYPETSDMDPSLHYVRYGWRYGCEPGPNFSGNGYLWHNNDVMQDGHNPLSHYIRHGKNEGREYYNDPSGHYTLKMLWLSYFNQEKFVHALHAQDSRLTNIQLKARQRLGLTSIKRTQTTYIVVHHSATPPQDNIGANEIHYWHRSRGFNKIGYHCIIRRDGTVEQGRGLEEVEAHTSGYNHVSVSVCLVGGVGADGKNNFTAAQWQSLSKIISYLKKKYPAAQLVGHRDLAATVCPGFDVNSWWQERQDNQQGEQTTGQGVAGSNKPLMPGLLVCLWSLNIKELAHHQPAITAFMKLRQRQDNIFEYLRWTWVDWENISPYMKKAVVLSEDLSFWRHRGFNWQRIRYELQRALLRKTFTSGCSTITQQLAKNLFLSPARSIMRKIKEAIITTRLERNLEKRRILEIYLNIVELGPNIFGVEEAARFYFNSSAYELTALQAAKLAALLPAPLVYTFQSQHLQGKIQHLHTMLETDD